MKGSSDEKLKRELKELIIRMRSRHTVEDINNDDYCSDRFADQAEFRTPYNFHSRQNIRVCITNSNLRRVMKSINTFADYIQPE